MTCIIVDDDQSCINTLEILLKKYSPQIKILGTAQTITDAVVLIEKNNPQFIFLDVEMNGEFGFDIFKFFPEPLFATVFTTAHEKYSLKAIKASCFDYLLKPINIEELKNTINKLALLNTNTNNKQNYNNLLEEFLNKKNDKRIAISTNKGFVFINQNDIICCKADGKYTQVYFNTLEKVLSNKNIGEFEALLDSDFFFRSHHSWIINLRLISSYSKADSQLTLKNGLIADLSSRKKEEFLIKFIKF